MSLPLNVPWHDVTMWYWNSPGAGTVKLAVPLAPMAKFLTARLPPGPCGVYLHLPAMFAEFATFTVHDGKPLSKVTRTASFGSSTAAQVPSAGTVGVGEPSGQVMGGIGARG
jgi:hypothetical protein